MVHMARFSHCRPVGRTRIWSMVLWRIVPIFVVSASVVAAPLLQWPAKIEIQISSIFGESRMDHFHAGVDIPGEGWSILPVDSGKILFRVNRPETPGALPFGGGKTLLVEHEHSWSGYMHLKSFTDTTLNPFPKSVERKTVLGTAGNTGHSGGAHLHFFLYDPKEKAVYNPLPLLPPNDKFVSDTVAPKLLHLGVPLPDRIAAVQPDSEFTMSGDFPLLAMITDSGTGGQRWGVHRLRVKQGGKTVRDIEFGKILLDGGKWKTSNGMAYEDVFLENWYVLGRGFRDSPFLEILAEGYSGPQLSEARDLKIVK